jgi:hypothetical protein
MRNSRRTLTKAVRRRARILSRFVRGLGGTFFGTLPRNLRRRAANDPRA